MIGTRQNNLHALVSDNWSPVNFAALPPNIVAPFLAEKRGHDFNMGTRRSMNSVNSTEPNCAHLPASTTWALASTLTGIAPHVQHQTHEEECLQQCHSGVESAPFSEQEFLSTGRDVVAWVRTGESLIPQPLSEILLTRDTPRSQGGLRAIHSTLTASAALTLPSWKSTSSSTVSAQTTKHWRGVLHAGCGPQQRHVERGPCMVVVGEHTASVLPVGPLARGVPKRGATTHVRLRKNSTSNKIFVWCLPTSNADSA